MGVAGPIVTLRDRLDGRVLTGEEGRVPIGDAIDGLAVILPPDDFGLAEVLWPGVITVR